MEKNTKNTKELVLNMVEDTRPELEGSRVDEHRFSHPGDYTIEESLKSFRDDNMRKKFVQKFWKK